MFTLSWTISWSSGSSWLEESSWLHAFSCIFCRFGKVVFTVWPTDRPTLSYIECLSTLINVYYAEKNGVGVVFQNKARPSLGLGWAMRFTNYRLKVRKSIFHSNYWILHLFTLHLCDNCWHHLLSRKDFGNWETCHNINYYPQLLSLWRYCLTVNNINLYKGINSILNILP